MSDIVTLAYLVTADALSALQQIDPARSAERPAPDKWSAREILGHLIDSAAVNHLRFLRACEVDHLDFEGYDQDLWVKRQDYLSRPWPDLVRLWKSLNEHIVQLVKRVPAAVLESPRSKHNLDRIAFKPVPPGKPATMHYLIVDYYEHLRHHIAQIKRAVAG